MKFGIVQGRLINAPAGELQCFPGNKWPEEFSLASKYGINYVEWLAERTHNPDNPLWTDEGCKLIKDVSNKNNLDIYSTCNDYVIDHDLTDKSDTINQQLNFMDRSEIIGASLTVLPLFEKSEMTTTNFQSYKPILLDLADHAKELNQTLCLETILNGKDLKIILEDLGHSNIKCVFDTGNRISHGHDIYNDIELLNHWIQHIHIKDKNESHENVLLGTGKVNFLNVMTSLKRINYQHSLTFETQRGVDPEKTVVHNLNIIKYFYANASS